MIKSWVCAVQENGVLELPDEVLKGLGWKPGDVLHWSQTKEGSVSAKKCAEITPMDLHCWFDDYWEALEDGEAFLVVEGEKRILVAPVSVALDSLSTITTEEGVS